MSEGREDREKKKLRDEGIIENKRIEEEELESRREQEKRDIEKQITRRGDR